MIFKTIKFKFLSWYIVILMLTLFIFSFVIYQSFKLSLFDDFDDLLSSRAGGVADAISAFWDAKKISVSQVMSQGDLADFMRSAQEWVTEKRKDPDLMSLYVQILDPQGKMLVSSKAMPHIAPIPMEDFEDVLDGDESFDTVKGRSINGNSTNFRVYTKPVMDDGKIGFLVQAAGPVTLLSLATNELKFILFVLLPLAILLAGIPGILLVRITLHPIDAMIATLRKITAENLKLKIHIPNTKNEMKKLADTFNDMIDRLDHSFSSHQRFIQDAARDLKIYAATAQTDGISKTIDDLLVISRLDDNMAPLEIRKMNLSDPIGKVFRDMKALAEKKDISASLSCPDDIVLDGDEKHLRQLFIDLLDNAIKYTPRKGRITLSAVKSRDAAKIDINDTGIGIAEGEMPYIFDRFYQGMKNRLSKNGFGLGLSRAKYIVEMHKGRISVQSRRGEGSTFSISLPLSYPG